MSEKSRVRLQEYFANAKDDPRFAICPVCECRGFTREMERHHVKRRLGENIHYYIYVHARCHLKIELFPGWSRREGFIEDDNDREQNLNRELDPAENMLGELYQHQPTE